MSMNKDSMLQEMPLLSDREEAILALMIMNSKLQSENECLKNEIKLLKEKIDE